MLSNTGVVVLTFLVCLSSVVVVLGRSADNDALKEYQYVLKETKEKNNELKLQLAIDNTKLEELNKLRTQEAEKFGLTTPPSKLRKYQTRLLKEISETEKDIKDLRMDLDNSNRQLEALVDSNTPIKNEKAIDNINEEIIEALEDQQRIDIRRAIVTTKLEELKKLMEAEKIDEKTTVFTRSQDELLNDFTEAKEKEVNLIVAAATIKTEINELKKQFIEAGGAPDTIFSITDYFQELPKKILKAEKSQKETGLILDDRKKYLEELQTTLANLNIKTFRNNYMLYNIHQKMFLKAIEKAKERVNKLTVEYAVKKTLGNELMRQLQSIEISTTAGSSAAK